MKKSLWLLGVLLSQTLIAQNVGIGTSNPQSTLDLKGNQRIGGAASYMTFDTLSGKIVWTNSNLFVPATQALMKHSAAADGLFYNNSGGTTGQLEYRNALGEPVFFTNFTNGKGYFKSRLGIATTTPLAGLHVADSSVLFSASGDIPGLPGMPPLQGPGRRLEWFPDKAAFRAGYIDSDQWDQSNIGNYSFATGNGTMATGLSSTALGENTIASGYYSTAMGIQTQATSYNTTAMGGGTIASGYGSTAMGHFTTAKAFGSLSIGVLNEDTDSPDEFTPNPADRMFQIGNGTDLSQRSNAFTVLRNGNTGIGLADPAFRLSFDPALGDKISLWSNSTDSYGFGIQSALLQIHTDVPYADIAFGYGSSDVMTERMRIVNTGGIGMELSGRVYMKNGTSPVDPDYSPGIWLNNSDNSELLGFMGTQNNQNLGFYGGSGGWGFVYDAIHSRVGIGTDIPASPIDVTGNTQITGKFISTSTSTEGIGVLGNCQTSLGYGTGVYGVGGNYGVYGESIQAGVWERIGVSGFANGGDFNYGTEGFAQSSTGTTATGIYGQATGPGTNWAGYFSGAVYATSYSSSDRKLKQDIQPLNDAISIIQQLNPTLYTYKTNEYKQMQLPEGRHYGLIADEVQQVIPGIVKKAVQPAQYEHQGKNKGQKLSDEVEFNAVNYTEIISILVAAVQEQQLQIDELKLLVEELQKK